MTDSCFGLASVIDSYFGLALVTDSCFGLAPVTDSCFGLASVTRTMVHRWLSCLPPGVIGSVLGLVSLVTVT